MLYILLSILSRFYFYTACPSPDCDVFHFQSYQGSIFTGMVAALGNQAGHFQSYQGSIFTPYVIWYNNDPYIFQSYQGSIFT